MNLWVFIFLIFSFVLVPAQDLKNVPGQWEMSYKPWPHIPEIKLEITIYEPIKEMIFPSRMNLSYGNFKGEYDFVMVKKGENKLGIARNKYPLKEEPFSLGPWMMYLNGHFELDSKQRLELKRLWIDHFGIFMAGLYDDEMQTNTKVFLRDFLYNVEISLLQKSKNQGRHPMEKQIIEPQEVFYGIYDPIKVKTPEIEISMLDEESYDKDSVTIVHNGKILADKILVEEVAFLDKIKLDEGDNFIAFFAENYGSLPPNTANFFVYTEGGDEPQYSFDFTARSNAYATLMVAHFIYQKPNDAKKETSKKKPETISPSAPHERKNKAVGYMNTSESKIFLEIWDSQKEDGDIVSVFLNGKQISERTEVKHQPKKIEIELKKGKNEILFKAENLGTIPPNTAALRVYGNGFEKLIQLNTDFKQNNVVEVFLE